jgi:hypothetical protein
MEAVARRPKSRLLSVLAALLLSAALLAPAGGSAAAGPVRGPGVTLADCLCGGPGGSPDLAHISPWTVGDCNTSVAVGTTSVYVWINGTSGLVKTYAGWAEWRYSSYRSCHGYQWVRYHLNMTTVHRSTVSAGFATMLWLAPDPLDWTTFSTTFSGGAADGAFSTYAIMAGPLQTTAGIWTSLAQFGPNRNFTA